MSEDYTLTGEKIRSIESRRRYFLIFFVSLAVVFGSLFIIQNKMTVGLLILINILAGEISIVRFTSGLKEIYRSEDSTEKDELKLLFQCIAIFMSAGTVSIFVYMYHLGLF